MRDRSLFDSFNARFLEPEQIGRGFIFTEQFREIAKHQHSLIIGPRGSGKTTYLKMLTLPALISWRDAARLKISKSIGFQTIYIPSDFSWYPEFRLPIDAEMSKEADSLLTTALFRSHVLLAMCDTIRHMSRPFPEAEKTLLHLKVDMTASKWDELTSRLAYSWDLKPPFGGVSGLRLAVEKNIQNIQTIMVRCAIVPEPASVLMDRWPVLTKYFFDDVRAFGDAIADIHGRDLNFCVCFDEVEIAPVYVRRQIMQSARSFDQRFLVKISSSPFDESDPGQITADGSMSGHDFNQIMLTQLSNSDIQRFSERLFGALCHEAGLGRVNPSALLGSSYFTNENPTEGDDETNGQPTPRDPINKYSRTGRHYRRFHSLASKDASFQRYLDKNAINLDEMDLMPDKTRAAVVRKVISAVVVRDEYIASTGSILNLDNSGPRFRSRKAVPEIYTGARTIFTLCEGNPRWLIGMLKPLMEHYKEQNLEKRSASVPRSFQARRIETTLQQYLSLISTIRANQSSIVATSAVKIIEQIGEYFRKETLVAEFNPDPIGSFVIDAKVEKDIVELIGRALNQGAFVLMPKKNQIFERGIIRGQRLRITHLLSPFFQTSIVAGRPIELSRIISEPVEPSYQIDLFSMIGGLNAN